MLRIAKKIIYSFNSTLIKIGNPSMKARGCKLFLTKLISSPNNSVELIKSTISRSKIRIEGTGNTLFTNTADIAHSTIIVQGEKNSIKIEKNACIRGTTIIIQGDYCSVSIGANTTFGGVRIVNIGTDCSVNIGADCMFSDNIEIWASDSHPIYNESHEMINHEESICIGDKVWVGAHARILKGVSVGNGSVIGMGSTVTKNIPPSVISVGSPNRTVKERITWMIDYPKKNKNMTSKSI